MLQSCKGGRVQHAEELIFYGADINQQNAGGNTALHVCAASNQVCVFVASVHSLPHLLLLFTFSYFPFLILFFLLSIPFLSTRIVPLHFQA